MRRARTCLSTWCVVPDVPRVTKGASKVTNPNPSVSYYLAQSAAHMRRGLWADERRLMDEAIRRFPDHPEICIRTAVANAEFDASRSAIYAKRAADLAPSDPTILVRAASLLVGLGEVEMAGPLARRASEIVDEDFVLVADLFHVIGRLGLARENDDVAERYLRLAFNADPSGAGHGEVLAGFLVQRERLEEALDIVHRALEEDPVHSEELLRLHDVIIAAREPR